MDIRRAVILLSVCLLLVACRRRAYTAPPPASQPQGKPASQPEQSPEKITRSTTEGRDFDRGLVDKIVKGSTTGAQIKQWFGEPYRSESMDDGSQVWVYLYLKMTMTGRSVGGKIDTKVDSAWKKTLGVNVSGGVVREFSFEEGPTNVPK